MSEQDEAKRLESLWGGEFGDEYSTRNADAAAGREAFWRGFFERTPVGSALEVGCNVGGNVRWVADEVALTVGLDVNPTALQTMVSAVPGAHGVLGTARSLPFRTGAFDMVFTAGVLIHQPPDALPLVMDEIHRVSGRLIACLEYHAGEETEVRYRGLERALWKRDYGAEYLRRFPELAVVAEGFLPKGVGSWDDVTWWLLEKR